MRNKSEKEAAREHRASPECTALVKAYKNPKVKRMGSKRRLHASRSTLDFIAFGMMAAYAYMMGERAGKDKAE